MKGFDTPWLGPGEFVDLRHNPACQVWDRLWKATEVVREAHHSYGDQGVSVCSLQGAPTTSRLGHCDSRMSTLHLSSENSIMAESYTRENKRATKAHWVSMAWQAAQEDHIYSEVRKLGLAEVTQEVTGCDRPTDDVKFSKQLSGFQDAVGHRSRDLEAEALQGERDDPVAGNAETGLGYHYDKALTQSELDSQLKEVWVDFQRRPEYAIVNRIVQTTDKDDKGNFISMPWWRWTVTQSWRQLRAREPEETLNGELPENDLYTLRSILQVGVPSDSELKEMNLAPEDRLSIIEMVWRQAPAFYQGPVLPVIRHFTFTKLFMSLVTDVPYRQKPLVIPLANEELVYSSIRAMIKDGVVEASLSPYNNGLLLVAKKASRPGAPSSGMRVVLDARGLNHITRRVSWPIEDLGLCLREVAGASFITVTDVLSGFHLIPLDPECRSATAFTCGSLGHLQYCRAGMGMANSPARFASALSGVLGGQRHNACGNGCNREDNECAPGPSPEDILNKTSLQVAAGVDVTVSEARQVQHRQECDEFHRLLAEGKFDKLLEDHFAVHRCLCIVYVDDITIATWYDRSLTTDSRMERVQLRAHIRDVEAVLHRMRSFGIVCKAVKSEIAKPRSELLGYVVGRDGLRVNANKIEKLLDLDLPHSREGLQFFIGLTGFYRQFVPRLAELETPLRELLKHPELPVSAPKRNGASDVGAQVAELPKCWHEAVPHRPALDNGQPCTYKHLYEQILYELAKFTALSSVDYRPQSGRVGVASDASKVGLAAVLFQETPWGTTKSGETLWVERPIAFYSKVLLEQYQGRAAYDRELAALTLAVRHWSKYLLGRQVVFIADHQPLGFMLEPKGTSAADKRQSTRLIHFILELSKYNATAEWRRGTQIPVVDCISRLLKVIDTIILTTKPCKGMIDPVRYDAECDKLSLVRSQPYTRETSDRLAKDYPNAEEGWAPEQDLEPAIQCIVSNTELWGIAREELLSKLKERNTVEELAKLGKNDAEIYLTIVGKAQKALEDAQQCRSLGQSHCSTAEWDSYVRIAQAIGISDYDRQASTLTPLRHISTGGVLRDNNMSGPAWVQIDHGKMWDLQKEPSLARDDTEVVMTVRPVELDDDRVELQDVDNVRHFSAFNVQITVDKTPASKLLAMDRTLCQYWWPIQEDESDFMWVTTLLTDREKAAVNTVDCESIQYSREGEDSSVQKTKKRQASVNCGDTSVDGTATKDVLPASVFSMALSEFAESPHYWQTPGDTSQYDLELEQMNKRLQVECNLGSYVSIQEGVDSSATTDMLAECALLVQACHIGLNAQGVTEPSQEGIQKIQKEDR